MPAAHSEPLFNRRFALACAVHFTGAMAASFYILVPLFIRQLGGTELTIGLFAGTTGAAAVLARIPVGRFLDTLGRRHVLLGAGALNVVAWLGFLFFREIRLSSALFVIVYGMAAGSLFASYFAYASDIIPVNRRSEGFAMFGVWGMFPQGLGPWIGEHIISRSGFDLYFVTAAGCALVSLVLSVFLPETVAGPPPSARHARRERGSFVTREVLALLGTALVFGSAMESVFVFFAPFSYASGRGPVGVFFMTYATTAVVIRVVSGRLPDRVGLRRVLLPALFAYACAVILIPHGPPALLIAIGIVCGASHGYAFPILNALIVELVPTEFRGRAVSWFTAMFDLGHTVANPLLGALARWGGYGPMYGASGGALLLTASVVAWRGRRPRRTS